MRPSRSPEAAPGGRPPAPSPFPVPPSPLSLLSRQLRQPRLHVRHLRLQLGIRIFPEVHEFAVARDGLLALAPLLVQLAGAPEHGGAPFGGPPPPGEGRRGQTP